MNEDYQKGFRDGFEAGYTNAVGNQIELAATSIKQKRKVNSRSSKAKLLDKMTKPVWDKYKKGRGKKTYVQIRAQVSRSQKYKKAVKRL